MPHDPLELRMCVFECVLVCGNVPYVCILSIVVYRRAHECGNSRSCGKITVLV